MADERRRLTDKQQAFCAEYLVDLNATQAAIRAGYSHKTADRIATQLMRKTCVAAEIARAKADRSRRTGITADRIVRELARIAFADPARIIDFEDASLRPDVSADDMAAVSGCKIKRSSGVTGDMTEREIKLCDKLRALDMLCKHLGMYARDKAGAQPEDGADADSGVVEIPAVMDAPAPPADDSDA